MDGGTVEMEVRVTTDTSPFGRVVEDSEVITEGGGVVTLAEPVSCPVFPFPFPLPLSVLLLFPPPLLFPLPLFPPEIVVQEVPKRTVVWVVTTSMVETTGTLVVVTPPGIVVNSVVTVLAVQTLALPLLATEKPKQVVSVVMADVVGFAVITLSEKLVDRLSLVETSVEVNVGELVHETDMMDREQGWSAK